MSGRAKRKVVVTGIGILSPLGADTEGTWKAMLNGTCGIRPLESPIGFGQYLADSGGKVAPYSLPAQVPARDARHMPPYLRFGLVAAHEAFRDAGLPGAGLDLERAGIVAGSVCGGAEVIKDSIETILDRGPRAVSPRFVLYAPINMLAGELSIRMGLKGPQLALSTHETTGLNAIGQAQRIIQYGDADVMLAGAADAPLSDMIMAAFMAEARVCTKSGRDHSRAADSRSPAGILLSEGAAMLVLEEREHALHRGARIYAELAGYASTADGSGPQDVAAQGDGLARAMRLAMQDADMSEQSVSYVSACRGPDASGRNVEFDAIEHVFASSRRSPVVTTPKVQLGDLMGAAGAIEAAITVLALRDQRIPLASRVQQQNAGEKSEAHFHSSLSTINSALLNGYGCGGNNAVLAWKRASVATA